MRAILFLFALMLNSARTTHGAESETDVLVYGATPAGIASALAAGRAGRTVLLVEPTTRIGGLVTNGLSHTDFRTFEGITGIFWEFNRRVENYYIDKFGKDSAQAKGNFRGTHAEPKVNLAVFESMLAEVATVRILTGHHLSRAAATEDTRKITSATFAGDGGKEVTFPAKIFIDATYEGDLMAAAGVEHTVGRDGREQYGESLAPEGPDGQLQAYNFRFIMTKDPGIRVLPVKPPGYGREYFLPVVALLEQGKFKTVVCRSTGGIIKAHDPTLPNGKFDMNDVSRGLVRLSLAGLNGKWPGGDAAERRKMFADHIRHNVGLLYFLQNDKAVPEKYRDEIREWGWCRDEFTDSGHIPDQLYVREARRMVGLRVFTEKDTEYAAGDARSVFQPDSIAMGDYGNNCHGTAHEGPRFGGKHTGEFYKKVAPYQIPYGTIVPKHVENLLVPVACSSSHVGFCALRLEPIWTGLGQAAGVAADLYVINGLPVQKINPSDIQSNLHAQDAATIYMGDVLPGHTDFHAVQWWASLGGFHGLAPTLKEPGQRGEHIVGQYFKAFPYHDAELEILLEGETKKRWLLLSKTHGFPPASKDTALKTRGDFIRHHFKVFRTPPVP